MEETLLDVVIASIFILVVLLIGFYLPYIAGQLFHPHNKYLLLETAGFLTYSTSEPGEMASVIYVTSQPAPLLEFRIGVPQTRYFFSFQTYSSDSFYTSIGYCIRKNLWEQVSQSVFFGVIG
ncbi:MAG: hypothetical protein ACPLX8_01515, partial [Nanopusillaceae archaeon]